MYSIVLKDGKIINIDADETVKCKVIGCHKAASDGYIIELINL